MPSAALHYFSGTGNSYRTIKIVGGKLKGAGYTVTEYRVTEGMTPTSDRYDLHVFAYPVYALDMPHIMYRYMKKLQPDKARAAAIAVFGMFKTEHPANGDDGYAAARAANILRSKGYDVVFTGAVGYPQSITQGLNPPLPVDRDAIRERSDKIVSEMADQIVEGARSYRHSGILYRTYAAFGQLFMTIGRRALGKLYVADDGCTGCGKCTRICPAGAITLTGGLPRWSLNCEACQRCINSCPHRAIQTSTVRMVALLLLQIASLIAFIALFFLPYGNYFQGVSLGPLQVSDWWVGFTVSLIVWLVAMVVVHILVDELIRIGERIPALNAIFRAGFTRGYRRYLDPGFDPVEHKGH